MSALPKYRRTSGISEQQHALNAWVERRNAELKKERFAYPITFGIERDAFLAGFRAAHQRLGLRNKPKERS